MFNIIKPYRFALGLSRSQFIKPSLSKRHFHTTMSTASRVVSEVKVLQKPPSDDEGEKQLRVFKGIYCHVPYQVKVVGEKVKEVCSESDLQNVIKQSFEMASVVFSHYNDDSEISKINNTKEKKTFTISEPLQKVLEQADFVNRVSRGVFDPALLAVTRALRSSDSDAVVEEKASYSLWSNIKLEGNTLTKLHPKVELDVLGLAKGFAVDDLVEKLVSMGIEDCYVDWGGDIRIHGDHPSYPGQGWKTFVRVPPDTKFLKETSSMEDYTADSSETQYLTEVMLVKDRCALATSGDYGQVVFRGEHMISHVVKPLVGDCKTSMLNVGSQVGVCQASVVTSTCALSDALATTSLIIGEDSAKAAIRFLEGMITYHKPVEDFICYSREGPKVIQYINPVNEDKDLRSTRLKKHEAAHVVIVGGGLAGLCAAIEAVKAGSTVTILDKAKKIGGNSAKASSGINGWGTRIQMKEHVSDDERYFERDTYRSGIGGKSDPSLVRMLSSHSANAVHWLMETFDLPLTVLSQLGGHSKRRTHRAPPKEDGTPVPVGWLIINKIQTYIETHLMDKITIHVNATVKKLNHEIVTNPEDFKKISRKKVTGIVYENLLGEIVTLNADAVVLTTGGFGCGILKDEETGEEGMRNVYRKDLANYPTTNGDFATGDGIKIAQQIGASLVDMDKVQVHPTGLLNPKDPANKTKFLGPEALRGSGGILLNQKGQRFVNELDLRSVVSKAIIDNCDGYPIKETGEKTLAFSYCVLNEEARSKFGEAYLNFYQKRLGLAEEVVGTDGLAKLIGCDVETLENTLREYSQSCLVGICKATGKTTFPSGMDIDNMKTSTFVVLRVTPSVHYCMGGLKINASCEVSEDIETNIFGKSRHIQCLFAAGEVTSGVHGANRLGGNSLLECVVFGRIAGERAATIKQNTSCLPEDEWVPVTFREMRVTDDQYGGLNTREFRFNLHGANQLSGMEVGQYIGIRGTFQGETIQSYYSPITRPADEGVISILCRIDNKGGPMVDYLNWMRPGHSCHLKAMGGLKILMNPATPETPAHMSWNDKKIKRMVLLCGGTGIAPMVQIIRSYIRFHISSKLEAKDTLRLIYAAEEAHDVAFQHLIGQIEGRFSEIFKHYIVLNKPPMGWTGGVGFVNDDTIRKYGFFPPEDDLLFVICGPPIFEKVMVNTLKRMGYPSSNYYSYSGAE